MFGAFNDSRRPVLLAFRLGHGGKAIIETQRALDEYNKPALFTGLASDSKSDQVCNPPYTKKSSNCSTMSALLSQPPRCITTLHAKGRIFGHPESAGRLLTGCQTPTTEHLQPLGFRLPIKDSEATGVLTWPWGRTYTESRR